jgi:hypothetical protein
MRDNGATENNRVMASKSCSDLWLTTNTTHSENVLKGDNSVPSYLTCMTHVRHVSLKWMTHMFHYTTYVFNKTLHMKKEEPYTCPTEKRCSRADGWHEALIPKAAKKNKPHIDQLTRYSSKS